MQFRITIGGFLGLSEDRRDLGWNTWKGALSMVSRELGYDRWEEMCIRMVDPQGKPEFVMEYTGLRNGGPDTEFIDRMNNLWRRLRSEGIPVTFKKMAEPTSA